MPNNLTRLAPTLFSAANTVSNEPAGLIRAISTTFDDRRVARGDKVTVPIAPTREAEDFIPGNVTTTGADAASDGVDVEITASKKVSWHLTGEQTRSLENGGTDQIWVRDLMAQGMRTLRNLAERDCALAIKRGASRAVGTAGTTPFAANLGVLTSALKVFEDNGAPRVDLQFVCDSSAALNLRNLGIIQDAGQAGTDAERRTGQFLRQFGFQIATSAGIAAHTKSSGTGYLANGAQAAGARSIVLDTGTGDVAAGDIVNFAGDTNSYVVNGGLSANAITLGRPGLRAALADNTAMTLGNNYVANLAFERNAVAGVMRPPVFPDNPTIEQMLISDQYGMTYLLLDIAQYGQRTWELHLAWGFKVVTAEHVVVVMG